MKKTLRVAGGLVITAGAIMILGTIGADDRMIIGQGVGLPLSELILRIMSGLAVCGIGSLVTLVGSAIK